MFMHVIGWIHVYQLAGYDTSVFLSTVDSREVRHTVLLRAACEAHAKRLCMHSHDFLFSWL